MPHASGTPSRLLPSPPTSLTVWSQLTHAISRAEGAADIYEAALDALETGLNVERSALLLFDDSQVMRFQAWHGVSESYRSAVEGHTPWTPRSRRVEPIVVPDVTQSAELAPHLEAFRAERIAALAFVPLEGTEGVIGKVMLYFRERRDLTAEEVQLARLIATQVAFALARTQAHVAVRESESRLLYALDAANMGTWEWDVPAGSVRWSENMERIHGLPPGGFDGTFEGYAREIHPDDHARVLASLERAIQHGVPHDIEYRIVLPDRSIRWLHAKGHVERAADRTPRRMSGICMDVTRRKHAELARMEAIEASHRASQRLAAIVESSDDAIVSKDLEGVITSWNRGAERMFGFTEAEAVGRPITLIVPLDLRAEEDELLDKIRAGHSVEMETVRQRRDGTTVEISLKVSPVRDAGGRIVGGSKIARDISTRKREEAERTELYRRLAILVEASASLLDSPESESVRTATVLLARRLLAADGYAVWSIDSRRQQWHVLTSEGVSPAFASRSLPSDSNPARYLATTLRDALAVPDVRAEPLLANQVASYQDEGIRSMLLCPMRFGAERAGTLAFYYRAPRGFTDVDVQTGQALANLAAAAMTTAELYGDQRTQRQQAESARRSAAFLADATSILSRSLEHEHTLAALTRLSVPEFADWCAVDILDDAGQLTRLAHSRSHAELDGSGGIPGGSEAADPVTLDDVREVLRSGTPKLTAAPAGSLPARHAGPAQRGAGEALPFISICVPLTARNHTIGAITFAFAESGRRYDEGDRMFVEEVAARAALAMDNAFAYRRAHEANRLKDEFLATLSHELRTPLNAILGYAQMLTIGVLKDEAQSKALVILSRNAQALRQIIDDVLDVSRITSGKLRLNVRTFALDEILRAAAATVQPAADGKGVSLDLHIDPGVALISGDPDRLQQVVWNLLSNAVKFTPPGGHIQLRLERSEASVEIVVSDDGRGIDPAFLPHMFERFRQADSRFSREHGGLGLGLAIVRELVELHGGTVSAESQGLGAGATFRARLPASVPPVAQPRGAQISGSRAEDTPRHALEGQLDGVRLLAVDDDEDSLNLLRIILESAGAEVVIARSALQAIELLPRGRYDALISDIGMPRMDGLELIRTIRRTLPPPANSVPAAALTAYARSEDRVTALASGFQMHIPKPVNPAELVTAIVALIRG